MNTTLKLGPLLSLEPDDIYSICFWHEEELKAEALSVKAGETVFSLEPLLKTWSGYFYRTTAKIEPKAEGRYIDYSISINGSAMNDKQGNPWRFYVPGSAEEPRIAYASCNGFSSLKLLKDTENPYNLWIRMNEIHSGELTSGKKQTPEPFSLLVMGGDQVYADDILSAIPALREWAQLTQQQQEKASCNAKLQDKIDQFYEELYIARWSEKNQARAFASIPQIMMWDDHDIFDGWGSFPDKVQNFDHHQKIFEAAKKYFKIFQLRGRKGLLNEDQNHSAFALKFRNYSILAMDHRSERSIQSIMSKGQWDCVIQWFKTTLLEKNLLVLSAVPVVYRDFSFVESYVENTPWTEEVTDDLRDHWRARDHQGERLRLVQQLLSELKLRNARVAETQTKVSPDGRALSDAEVNILWHSPSIVRTVILSGDVHVGALGVIMDRREANMLKIHQVVSSGIVHPPPTRLEWMGILATTNDKNEFLNEDKTIETTMLAPVGSDKYIRARNFATLQQGSDGKLWINWINESKDKAEYPLD